MSGAIASNTSLSEVFGQELDIYLHSEEAQDQLVDRDMFDFESPKRFGIKGYRTRAMSAADPFFDDFSPEEFGLDSEDLFQLHVLVPFEHMEQVQELIEQAS